MKETEGPPSFFSTGRGTFRALFREQIYTDEWIRSADIRTAVYRRSFND